MENIAFLSTYYFKLKQNAPRGRGRQDRLFEIIRVSVRGKEGDDKEWEDRVFTDSWEMDDA